MHTMTFVFAEDRHWSKSVVTAETPEECVEKYFLKYPERAGDPRLEIVDGPGDDISFGLSPR